MTTDTKLKLTSLIVTAQTILITSHYNPDPDAICSALFTYKILKENFPEKNVCANIEDCALYFDFIKESYEITSSENLTKIIESKPDLIIMLDQPNLSGSVKETNAKALLDFVSSKNIPFIVIDHHAAQTYLDKENPVFVINEGRPSACEQTFVTFIENLNLKKFKGYETILMTGILRDTMWFSFLKDKYKESFRVAGLLMDDGANIEYITQNITRFSNIDVKIIGEYLKNLQIEEGFTYSYLSDEFYEKELLNKVAPGLIARTSKEFNDTYLVKIDKNTWGFSVKKSPAEGPNIYSISFRGINGTINVAVFAKAFNGGGHKGAAGGIVTANNESEAIAKIINAINTNLKEAKSTA